MNMKVEKSTKSLWKHSSVADPRGAWGAWGPVPPPPLDFFLKAKFISKKLVLNKHEMCLKMLEMAILETQISNLLLKISTSIPVSYIWESPPALVLIA